MNPTRAGKSISLATVLERAERVLTKSFEDKNSGPQPEYGPKHRKGQVRLREASFEDYAQISQLHARNGLTTRSQPERMALWKGNPVYEKLRRGWPIGWVLETEDGAIAGSIDNVPFAYHFRGRELLAAAACSWAVDAPYRSYSMLLLDRLTRQENIDLAFSTTVSSNAEPVLKICQWSLAPVGSWDKSAFWITNYRGFVRSVLNVKSVPMGQIISYPVSAGLFCWDRFKHWETRINGGSAEIELCSGFDGRFDDFWEELKSQNHNILLAARDRETLAWHFRYALMRRNIWILAVSKGGRLAAYAVFDRQDNATFGLKRVRLVDFQALNGFGYALPAALRWMLQKCREEGIHILENVGCWLDRPALPPSPAPYHRTLPSSMFYYNSSDRTLVDILREPKVWAPSSFDGDASL